MIIPSSRPKKHARIEIVPLIDIMFFLLATFVMVSLSMVKTVGLRWCFLKRQVARRRTGRTMCP